MTGGTPWIALMLLALGLAVYALRVALPDRRSLQTAAAGDRRRDRETAVAIHRISADRIVEHWSDGDDLGLMQQLGVVSPPGG